MDSLGLAMRMSLQKTFLPSLDFMCLDEPGAACDDGRETAMLGVLASSGYEQVILVTHSDLADSFATQVVQI
jgi:ABC-type transport system involved in cytochrome bd biosynthesis fused ATPase/permease subunit